MSDVDRLRDDDDNDEEEEEAVDDLAIAATWVTADLPSTIDPSSIIGSQNQDLAALREEICLETEEPITHYVIDDSSAALAAVAAHFGVDAAESDSSDSESSVDMAPNQMTDNRSGGKIAMIGGDDDDDDTDACLPPTTKHETPLVPLQSQPQPVEPAVIPDGASVRFVGTVFNVSFELTPRIQSKRTVSRRNAQELGASLGDAPLDADSSSVTCPGNVNVGTSTPAIPTGSTSSAALSHPQEQQEQQCLTCTLVVQAVASGDSGPALDEGSMLCLSDRRTLGKVLEVFGPVKQPLYLLRLLVAADDELSDVELARRCPVTKVPSAAPICAGPVTSAMSLIGADYGECSDSEDDGIPVSTSALPIFTPHPGASEDLVSSSPATSSTLLAPMKRLRSLIRVQDVAVGMKVSYAPDFASFVFPERVLAACPRGTDASNLWDEEGDDEQEEFSDDEKEAAARRGRKAAKSSTAQAWPTDVAVASAASSPSVSTGRGGAAHLQGGGGRGGARVRGSSSRGRGTSSASPAGRVDQSLIGRAQPSDGALAYAPWSSGLPQHELAVTTGAGMQHQHGPPGFAPFMMMPPPPGTVYPGGATLTPQQHMQMQMQAHLHWQYMMQSQIQAQAAYRR